MRAYQPKERKNSIKSFLQDASCTAFGKQMFNQNKSNRNQKQASVLVVSNRQIRLPKASNPKWLGMFERLLKSWHEVYHVYLHLMNGFFDGQHTNEKSRSIICPLILGSIECLCPAPIGTAWTTSVAGSHDMLALSMNHSLSDRKEESGGLITFFEMRPFDELKSTCVPGRY